MVCLNVALPLDLRVAHVKCFLEAAVGRDPSGDGGGRGGLEQGPQIRVGTLKELMITPLNGGLNSVRNISVIDNQMGRWVALVSP